jgi:hypothetical protein
VQWSCGEKPESPCRFASVQSKNSADAIMADIADCAALVMNGAASAFRVTCKHEEDVVCEVVALQALATR